MKLSEDVGLKFLSSRLSCELSCDYQQIIIRIIFVFSFRKQKLW